MRIEPFIREMGISDALAVASVGDILPTRLPMSPRRLTKVQGEWGLLLTAYNLGRLHASDRLQPGLNP